MIVLIRVRLMVTCSAITTTLIGSLNISECKGREQVNILVGGVTTGNVRWVGLGWG